MAKRKIDGVLLLDKPFGVSSNNALQKARWLLQAEKAGHTGVLDPFATGLLLKAFTGDIEQVPPMHSALKYQGKSLYEYARQGVEIERAARAVTIYSLDIVSFEGDVLVLDVSCSKGTYVRTLADDIGRALGCGAYLSGLRRTRTAGFSLDDAIGLDELGQIEMPQREALLMAPESLVTDLPQIELDDADADRIVHGMSVPRRSAWPDGQGLFRLYGAPQNGHNRAFLGLGEVASDDVLRSKRLLSTA
jgi:tRNA pseudouridine55 synthase